MGSDEPLFKTLAQIADAIVGSFPRHLEVVVHDRSLPEIHPIHRRRCHASKTRRPCHRYGDQGPSSRRPGIRDRLNYKTNTKDGRVLKSSTAFIRDDAGEVIAAFCINFDMTDYLNAVHALEIFSSTASSFNGQEKVETFAVSITETIESLFNQAVVKIGKQSASMSTEEKLALVKELETSGVFQIKGAVDQTAWLMGVSKYTVYNYLKKIRAEADLNPL